MLTFSLTETGYIVNIDGKPWVKCPFDPAKGGETPFDSPDAARAHALENYPDATEQ